MTLENNNLKKKLADGSFEELYQNTEDFQKLNCAKNAEEVLEILNKYGYNGNSETLIREVLELLNEININDLKNVSGGKSLGKKLGHKLGGPALALLAGLTPNVRGTADTASDIQLTTTALDAKLLDAKLLDQELSKAKQNKNKNSTSLVPTITPHAAEIVISSLLTVVIKNSFGKDQLSQSCPDNVINNEKSSDLPVLNNFYNELKDSLQTDYYSLTDLKRGLLYAFIHSLLQTINLELHYFEKRSSSSGALLEKIFTDDVLDCRADMLILRTVEAYLNPSMDVDNPPPALENPDDLLTRFRHTLPDSPITNIIENLVNSAKNEKVEIIDSEDSHQRNKFDDNENNENDENDPPKYRTKKMGYNEAVNYLKKIGYLSNADSLENGGINPLWTIGNDYYYQFENEPNLTLQEHIEHYNAKLQSEEIKYTDKEKLTFITLT